MTRTLALTTALTLFAISSVAAQDTGSEPVKEVTIPPQTVNSERGSPRETLDSPRPVFRLERDAIISETLPRSLPELLGRIPGVHAQETARGQGSPFVRGLTSRRVVLAIDGIRINNSVFRAGPNQYTATVDPLLLQSAEVLPGSGSLLYGSDALGGVIMLQSRGPGRPSETLLQKAGDPTKFWLRSEAFTRYSSVDNGSVNRLAIRGSDGDTGFIGGFSYRDFKNFKAGASTGRVSNTAHSQRSSDLKLVRKLSKKESLTLAFQRTDQRNVPRTHSTLFSKSYRGTTVPGDLRRDTDQSRQLIYLQASSKDHGIVDQARVSLSWQRQYQNESRIRTRNRRRRQGFTVDTLGSFIELSLSPLSWISLKTGVDFYHDEVSSFRSDRDGAGNLTRRPRGPVADNATYDLFGVYALAEIPVGELITLSAGGRYEFAHARADDVDPDLTDATRIRSLDRSYDGVIGSFSATLKPTKWARVIASLNEGFRAPNLDDTTSFNDVRSNSVDVPARDLDPERSLTAELGVKLYDKSIGRLQAFVYRTWLRGFIGRVATGATIGGASVFERRNFSDGRIDGAEASGELLVPGLRVLSIYGSASWTYGEADSIVNGFKSKEPLSRINPARGIGGLRWRGFEKRVRVELETVVARAQNRLSPSDKTDTQRIPRGGTPGYVLINARVSARIAKGVRATASLENIFDRDYRVHGSGQNGPGLGIVLGLNGTF